MKIILIMAIIFVLIVGYVDAHTFNNKKDISGNKYMNNMNMHKDMNNFHGNHGVNMFGHQMNQNRYMRNYRMHMR